MSESSSEQMLMASSAEGTAEKTNTGISAVQGKAKSRHKPALLLKTAMLVLVWVTMGMSQVLLSTTMPDSRARLGVSVEQMSRALSIASVGALIGAPMGSLADRYSSKVDGIISGCLVICAFLIATRSLTSSLIVFTVSIFLDGLTWTCLNSAGNSLLMDLWGDKGGAPMHALHFGYPIGAMVGPLICYPFVSVERPKDNITTNITTTMVSFSGPGNFGFKDNSKIEIPYAIVGLIIATVAVIFAIFQCKHPSRNIASYQKKEGYSWKDVFSPGKWAGDDTRFGILMVGMLMTFFAVHVSTIKASLIYYTTYAVEEIGYTNQQAALYTSVVGFSAMAGRGVAIIVSYFVPIQVMLMTEVHGMVMFSIVTLLWGLHDKKLFIIFCCFFTFFREPIWPSSLAWTDQYIALFAIVVGLAGMAGKLSDALFSWLLGYLYTYTVPESLFYNTVASGVLLCVLVIVMNCIAHKHGSRFTGNSNTDRKDI